MNYITRLCFLIFALSALNFAVPPKQTEQSRIYKALIFHWNTREIYKTRPSDQIVPNTYDRWVIACAANSALAPEEKFNQNSSLEKKVLFVENIVEPTFADFGNACYKPFQISAAYHSSAMELQFGYEVYYDNEKFGGFKPSDDENIRSIKQYISFFFHLKTTISKSPFDNLTLGDDQKINLNFLWVPRIHLQHDYKKWNPKIIRYKMQKNFPKMLQKCDDYQLAEDYFGSDDIVDSFYNQENQKQILQGVDVSLFSEKFKCDPENEKCLTKWQLIPPNQINFESLAPKTCSNLTTVPIWSDFTQIPLENLQLFLQAMIRRLKDNLDIIITTALSKTDDNAPNPIYMHKEGQKIPIPDTIYYLIKYKIPYCNISGIICDHAIIIVIHNDPNFNQNDQLCSEEEDLCQKLGWSWIQYEDTNSESSQKFKYDNIYCCEPIDHMLVKFKIKAKNQPQMKFNPLHLRQFPQYDKKTGEMEWIILEDSILEEIENMKKENDVSSQASSFEDKNGSTEGNQSTEADNSPRKSKSFDFKKIDNSRQSEMRRIVSSS